MKGSTAPISLEALVASAAALPQTDISTEAELETKLRELNEASTINSQLRLSYANQPARFLQSELTLDDAIRAFAPVAVSPRLYPSMIALGALRTLVDLLSHTNEDILCRSVAVLHDLAVVDSSATDSDESRSLYDALLRDGVFATLADVLDLRLLPQLTASNVDDAATVQDAVTQIFSIFENSLDVRPDLVAAIAKSSRIIETCIKQVNSTQPSSIAVELLAVFLQDAPDCKTQFVKQGGINALLEALAPFRKRKKERATSTVTEAGDAESRIEHAEMVENMFGVLCSALLGGPGAKIEFLKVEGFELMVSFVKSSRAHRRAATKVLDFACTGYGPGVRRLLECGGVGVIFAVLGTIGEEELAKSGKKRRRGMYEDEVKEMTEHVFGILFNMFRYTNDDNRQRLMLKLRENGAVKTRKVTALYRYFAQSVETASGEPGRYLLTADGETRDADRKQDDNDEDLVNRLEAGLLIVQMGAGIVGHVIAYGDKELRNEVLKMLPQVRLNTGVVCDTLQEYAASVDDGEGEAGRLVAAEERTRILTLTERVKKEAAALEYCS